MPLPNGHPSLMDAILAGQVTSFQLGNKDGCFKEPVRSVLNGKHYTSAKDYNEHLKANNCEIVGNDSSLWKTAKK